MSAATQPDSPKRQKITSEKFIVFIHSDPSMDIDDEEAIYHMIQTLLKMGLTIDVHIVINVKTSQIGIKRLKDISFKLQLGIDFGELNIINIRSSGSGVITVELLDNQTNINIYPDAILSIAPGLDTVIDVVHLSNVKYVSHQGLAHHDLSTDKWKGVNDTGSTNILSEIIKMSLQGKLVYVRTTPIESFEHLFSPELFTHFNINPEVQLEILKSAFKLCIGRMQPNHPYISALEALINLRIAEIQSKPGTNYRLVKKMYDLVKSTGKQLKEISAEEHQLIKHIANKYIDEIIAHGIRLGKTFISDVEGTKASLIEITTMLAELSMPYYNLIEGRLMYSDDMPGGKELFDFNPEAFAIYHANGIGLPAYDLIACVKLFEIMKF